MLGRWNDDLKENERTQQVMRGRKHPKKETPMSDWTQLQREIPYAWRFNKPLQRRLAVKGGDDSENPGDAYKDLSDIFDKSKAKTVCDSCHKGQQVVPERYHPKIYSILEKWYTELITKILTKLRQL